MSLLFLRLKAAQSLEWMFAANRKRNDSRCKAKNSPSSVDAHSQNGAVIMLLSLLPTKAANTPDMDNSDQITVQ